VTSISKVTSISQTVAVVAVVSISISLRLGNSGGLGLSLSLGNVDGATGVGVVSSSMGITAMGEVRVSHGGNGVVGSISIGVSGITGMGESGISKSGVSTISQTISVSSIKECGISLSLGLSGHVGSKTNHNS